MMIKSHQYGPARFFSRDCTSIEIFNTIDDRQIFVKVSCDRQIFGTGQSTIVAVQVPSHEICLAYKLSGTIILSFMLVRNICRSQETLMKMTTIVVKIRSEILIEKSRSCL